MPLFQAEVLEAVEYLRTGTSVDVVGTSGMGRTSFVRRVVESLERSGVHVVELASTRHGTPPPFSGVREAGVTVPRDGAAIHPVAAALARELLPTGSAAIVLDDADDIDEESRAVVAVAHQRVGVPVLTTRLPHTGGVVPAGRWCPARDAVRIVLGPLSYQQTSELVHASLDGPVDSRVIAYVHTWSSGITGLVGPIVRTAVLSAGLVESGGMWRMETPTLWNRHLVPLVEHLLAGLDARDYRTAYELALLGPASMDKLVAIDRARAVARLEEKGLVSTTRRESWKTVVTLRPQLVVDYFRDRLPEVTGTLVARDLAERLDLPVTDLLEPSQAPDSGEPVHEFVESRDADLPILVRYFGERLTAERVAREDAWVQDPTVTHAIAYLAAVWEGENDPGLVRGIFDRTDQAVAGAPADALVAYSFAKVYWHAFVAHDARAVARTLRWLVSLSDDNTSDAQAMGLFIRAVGIRVRPVDIERSWGLVAARPDCWMARFALLAALTVHGEGDRALALGSLPARTPGKVGSYWEFFRVFALVEVDRFDEALETALEHVTNARLSFDRPLIYLYTFAAVQCLFRMGRWEQAASLLSETYAIGAPGETFGGIYKALLRMGALLMFLTGHRSAADSLLVESQGGGNGPMSWMQQETGDAIRSFIDGDAGAAADSLVQGAERGRANGYRSVVRLGYLFSVWVDPTRSRIEALDAVCADETVSRPGRHMAFRRYVRRALDDPEGIVRHATGYGPRDDLHLALDVTRRLADRTVDARLRRLAYDAVAVLAGRLGQEATPSLTDSVVVRALTEREIQIALLAASRSNAEIAADLHLSRRTVENHIHRALKKTGARSRAGLAELVLAAGGETLLPSREAVR